ncbi:hypothetical protein [Pandoraea communis]|uniref:hypothetical protein n=1 Tax=Pandoraea communis TaxID=2508297 RepID=UPI0025A4D9D2|nr:hypothetical protein [Pandoraea communis]MDM8357505.1 hypothetical protein [Pandoraea communis]
MAKQDKVVNMRSRTFDRARPLVDSGGGPPHDGDMETRVAKLEVTIEHIQRDVKELKDDVRALRQDISGIRTTDFRITFGAIIAVALGLAGLMAKGFHWF